MIEVMVTWKNHYFYNLFIASKRKKFEFFDGVSTEAQKNVIESKAKIFYRNFSSINKVGVIFRVAFGKVARVFKKCVRDDKQ